MSDESRWDALRRATAARIGLARAGASIATRDHLAFQAAHAQARDAVASRLDVTTLRAQLGAAGCASLALQSGCADLPTFLRRPDLGRRLAPAAAALLAAEPGGVDVAFVISGGLAAAGVAANAPALLAALLPTLRHWGWSIAPVVVVELGRVAVGDEVGERLAARLVVVLVGERPGLSSPDSMGAYLTWAPRVGRSDAERNCLSNIRPAGLKLADAAYRLLWLIGAAAERQLSGVTLKDESEARALVVPPVLET
jgi:ethanolamine ammonia-lyase small subunit